MEAICFSKLRSRRKSVSHCTSGMIDFAKSSKLACLNLAASKASSVAVSTKARRPSSLYSWMRFMVALFGLGSTTNENRGRELTVLGLAEAVAKGGYRPTNAGWVMIGNRGRAFQPR